MTSDTILSTVDNLADAAAMIALRAARAYLDQHKLTATPTALSACLTSWVNAKLPEALADARSAFACHMDKAAVQTFGASMALAGIEAAKEAGEPVVAYCGRGIAEAFGLDKLPARLIEIVEDVAWPENRRALVHVPASMPPVRAHLAPSVQVSHADVLGDLGQVGRPRIEQGELSL